MDEKAEKRKGTACYYHSVKEESKWTGITTWTSS